jgi:hypothetical protein
VLCFFSRAEELLLDDIGNNFLCMDGDTAFTTFSNSGDDMFVCLSRDACPLFVGGNSVFIFFSLPPFHKKNCAFFVSPN